MQHKNILVAKIDNATGELGFCLSELRSQDEPSMATEGLLMAHDLIEHVNGVKNIGSIPDELQALGGIWFVRGQFNDISRNGRGSMHTSYQHVASDVTRMARDWCYSDDWMPLTIPKRLRCNHLDNLIEIAAIGKHNAMLGEYPEIEREDQVEFKDRLATYWRCVLPLMVRGFNKAARRWKSAIHANSQFWNIANALDPYVKHPECEGQQLLLRWGSGEATCEEHYEDW